MACCSLELSIEDEDANGDFVWKRSRELERASESPKWRSQAKKGAAKKEAPRLSNKEKG
jgi:hypothetical protein